MTDLMRKTKKELVEMIENSVRGEDIEELKKELEELKLREAEREAKIEMDLSFGATPEERKTHAEKQKAKDEMLRATNWRFTSQKSKQDYETEMAKRGMKA